MIYKVYKEMQFLSTFMLFGRRIDLSMFICHFSDYKIIAVGITLRSDLQKISIHNYIQEAPYSI